jgi:flagellar protein FlaG
VSTDVRTDVEIISDAGSPVYNISGAENVTLLVKNTGAQPLPVSHEGLDVLIDGRYQTNVTVTRIGGDGSYWGTNEVVKLAIHPEGLAPGDHRVKLIVNGDAEVFTFRVP